MSDIITLGIDASTTNIGIAYYTNGHLSRTENLVFKGTYDSGKLKLIVKTLNSIISRIEPKFIILEAPITGRIRNTKAMSSLNQVAGAICAVSFLHGTTIYLMHNMTAKSALGITNKSEVPFTIEQIYPHLKDEDLTEHEFDAILVVEAYNKLYVTS